MKTISLLFFLCFSTLLLGQNIADCPNCPKYHTFMKKGQGYLEKKQYDQAITEFQAAQIAAGVCDCSTAKATAKVSQTIQGIQAQKEDAEDALELAEQRAQEAQIAQKAAEDATQRAEIEKQNAQTAQALAEQQTRTAQANELAYRANEVLQSGDRSLAMYLGTFAHHYLDSQNVRVGQVITDAYYYNDHPDRQADSLQLPWSSTYVGHTSNVNAVAFSPNGQFAISASDDNTLKLWNVNNGQEIRTFKGHTSSVYAVAFSPNGQSAISASDDQTLKLWNVNNGQEIRTFKGHTDYVYAVAFSPNGQFAISASFDKTLKLWNVNNGQEIRTFKGHTSFVNAVAFSPNGQFAISASDDQTLKLWNVDIDAIITQMQSRGVLASPPPDALQDLGLLQSVQQSEYIQPLILTQADEHLLKGTALNLWEEAQSSNNPDIYQPAYTKALECLRAAAKRNPAIATYVEEVYIDWGRKLLQDKRFRLAKEKAEKAYAIRPSSITLILLDQIQQAQNQVFDFTSFLSLSTDSYLGQAAQYFLEQQQWDKAQSLSEKAFKINPKVEYLILIDLCNQKRNQPTNFTPFLSLSTDYDLGQAAQYFLEQQQWDKAQSLSEKAFKIDPKVEYLILIDLCNQKQNQPTDFTPFLSLSTDYDLGQAAQYFLEQQQWDKAQSLSEKASKIDPKVEYLILIDLCNQKQNQPTDFTRYEDSFLVQDSAQVKFNIRQFREAGNSTKPDEYNLRIYQWIYRLINHSLQINDNPADRKAFTNDINSLGWYQLLTAHFADCEQTIRRGFELDSTNIYLKTNLPPALLFQGKYEEAKLRYQEWADVEWTVDNRYQVLASAFLDDFDTFEQKPAIQAIMTNELRDQIKDIKQEILLPVINQAEIKKEK